MLETVFFYLLTIPMIAAALSVILNRQPIYSVLSLLVVMLCLASLFIMLGAYVAAALQILLYAGAVLVLFLFISMLLNLAPESLARMRVFTRRTVAALTGVVLLVHLVRIAMRVTTVPSPTPPMPTATVRAIGTLLFSTYLLPFELTSFLILAAIIAAVTLATRDD